MALINCPECGKEISDKATACPSCGCPIHSHSVSYEEYSNNEYDSEPEEKESIWSKISSFFIYGFAIILAISFISSIFSSNKSDDSVSKKGTNNSVEAEYISYTEISSTDLISIYKENQVNCKQLYDGVYLEVTGPVISVGTGINDKTYVCLGSENDYAVVGIQCYAANDSTVNAIAGLQEGDIITMRGIGDCGSLSFSLDDSFIFYK